MAIMGVESAEGIKKLDVVTFDELLRAQKPFETKTPCIDLSSVEFVSPAGMVQLVSACHALSRDGRKPGIVLPSTSARSYLSRAGVLSALNGAVTCASKSDASLLSAGLVERGRNSMLLEVTRLDSMGALPRILDRLVVTFRQRLRYTRPTALMIATAVSEVCQNAVEHATEAAGFLAVQVYNGKRRRFVEIGMSDYGPGLAVTLRRNAMHAGVVSDSQAIRVATKRGTSGISDDPTRGTGLYHLLEIARKHAGTVDLRSGTARSRWRMDRDEQAYSFTVPRLCGVHVAISLPDGGSG